MEREKERLNLGIFWNFGCRIHKLPEGDYQKYRILLKKEQSGLSLDVRVKFECIQGSWFIQDSTRYTASFIKGGREDRMISAGDLIRVQNKAMDEVIIAVWDLNCQAESFEKYRVLGSQIIIGSEKKNDIICNKFSLGDSFQVKLIYKEDHASLTNISDSWIYLNKNRVRGTEKIEFGDEIQIYDIRIIFLGNVLAVSSADKERIQVHYVNLRMWTTDMEAVYLPPKSANESSEITVHIAPRQVMRLYKGTENIDGVPAKREEDGRPAWMSILPPLTMVLPMMLGYSLMGSNMMMGIIIAGGSAVVGTCWAAINLIYNKREIVRKEQLRLKKYEEYLIEKSEKLRKEMNHNQLALKKTYPSAEECSGYAAGTVGLWGRRPQDKDFLYVRLGLGDMPFQIKVSTPSRGFSVNEDELSGRAEKLARNFEQLRNVPQGISIMEHSVIGILTGKSRRMARNLMQIMITQIAANHTYTDVRLAVVFNKSTKYSDAFEFARWLPHIWNDDKSFRYYADDDKGADAVFYELTQVFRKREEERSNTYSAPKTFFPYFVLVVDDPAVLESRLVQSYLFKGGRQLGVTTIIMADRYESLPGVCSLVIARTQKAEGIWNISQEGNTFQPIKFDTIRPDRLAGMALRQSTYKVFRSEGNQNIPESLEFFEMIGANSLRDLNVLEHWQTNNTYDSMRALVGRKAGGVNCYLDIHEKVHGPHGLVAGTTGSGKSETLQTYILSMAITYSPVDVALFIIDYKGGGMANLFKDLPHTIGQISNLSGNQIHRAMVAINSEKDRREHLFSRYRVKHIDEYMRLYRRGETEEPMPHLLIIIDEFAELKQEEPEFMKELISLSRVGRSLGVHLILATQKPAGTVDDNIWSNTKFRLCLRVEDKQDSMDVLHCPDAAYLTRPGRCYLQVGNGELYELFQSGWSGAPYKGDESDRRVSASMIDCQGREVKAARRKKKAKDNDDTGGMEKTQLDAVVSYLAHVSDVSGVKYTHRLWLPLLPRELELADVVPDDAPGYADGRWPEPSAEFELSGALGLADDPADQKQFPISIDLAQKGHLIVAGGVTSGKSTLLQTLIYSFVVRYSPEQLNLYLIDFSNQMLTPYQDAPHVGGVVLEGEDDKLRRFFGMVDQMLKERKSRIRGGNYSQHVLKHGYTFPAVIIVIDGYANFREKTEDAYENSLMELSRSAEGYGIFLIISCGGVGSAELQSKIADNMRQSICLEFSDKFRYGELLKTMRFEVLPEANTKGRGLALIDGNVLEYQTALVRKAKNDYERAEWIENICCSMKEDWKGKKARRIPEIPDKPTWQQYEQLDEYQEIIKNAGRLPAGWFQEDAALYAVDLTTTYCYLVLGRYRSGKKTFLRNVAYSGLDKGGRLLFYDGASGEGNIRKKEGDILYADSPQLCVELVRQLTLITNERAPKRKEYRRSGMDDEEIFRAMAEEFPPVFLIITDLKQFFELVYRKQEDIGLLKNWIENIFEKGQLLNVFVFAAIDTDDVSAMAVYPAWHSFLKDRTGIVMGGELNRQSVFTYQNISFNDQGARLAAGLGYAVNQEDHRMVDFVVIPQNRGER